MTLKTEVVRGLKWTAGAKFGGQLITWGITIFVMRLLAPADYGLLAMATVFITLLAMFAEIGLGPALVQVREIGTTKLRQAFGIVLLLNLALCLLLNLLAAPIAAFYAEPRLDAVVRVLSLQFLLTPFYVLPDVVLQRRLEFRQRSLIELGAAIGGSVATLALALAHWGVWALVLGNLVSIAWRAVAVNLVAPFRHWPSFSWQGMRGLLFFGGNVAGSRLLWFVFTQADTVIVGRLLGGQVLGFYSVAMHLASLPVQRMSAILNQVAFPAFSRFQHDPDLIAAQLRKAFGLMSLISFPILWGMSSTAREIVLVLLGPGWEDAVLPLQILTLVMPFRTLAGFLPSITDAVGRPEVGFYNVLLGCLTMPPAFYFGSRWGIAGVACAWITVYPVVLLLNMQRMLGVIDLKLASVSGMVMPPLLCAAGMYAAVWCSGWLLASTVSSKSLLVVEIGVGATAYALLTLAINRAGLKQLMQLLARRQT